MLEILVVTHLEGSPAELKRARQQLGELGLRRGLSNVYLPAGTLIGTWEPEATDQTRLAREQATALFR